MIAMTEIRSIPAHDSKTNEGVDISYKLMFRSSEQKMMSASLVLLVYDRKECCVSEIEGVDITTLNNE